MTEQRENKMGTMGMPRLVATVSFPLMVSMLVQSLYNIVDGIYVSRISENALTATSLAYPAQMLMIAVSVGTGVGVNSLLARTLGKKQYDQVNRSAANGLFLAAVCSLAFMALGATCVPAFLGLFTDDPEILGMGVQYLRICLIFSQGIFVATTGERLLQATGRTMLSMSAQILGAVVNIVLDPILIFGWFGLPQMGVAGAACATVIGQWMAAIASLLLNHWKNKEVGFALKGFRPDWAIIRAIYQVGVPTILLQTAGSLMMVSMNKILVPFSTTAVAVFGVYYKLQNFVFMPVNGLAQGLIPIVGYNYGAKNGDRVLQALKVTVLTAAAIMLAGTVVFLAVPDRLLMLFDANQQMLALGVPALRTISATFVLSAVTITVGYAMSGMGNGVVSMMGTMIRQLIVLVPCAWALAWACGLDYMWYAFWISEAVAALYALFCLRRAYRTTLRLIRVPAKA